MVNNLSIEQLFDEYYASAFATDISGVAAAIAAAGPEGKVVLDAGYLPTWPPASFPEASLSGVAFRSQLYQPNSRLRDIRMGLQRMYAYSIDSTYPSAAFQFQHMQAMNPAGDSGTDASNSHVITFDLEAFYAAPGNDEYGNQTSGTMSQENLTVLQKGIHQARNVTFEKYGIGDAGAEYVYMKCMGGSINGDDEGQNLGSAGLVEGNGLNGKIPQATIQSIGPNDPDGVQVLNIAPLVDMGQFGAGRYAYITDSSVGPSSLTLQSQAPSPYGPYYTAVAVNESLAGMEAYVYGTVEPYAVPYNNDVAQSISIVVTLRGGSGYMGTTPPTLGFVVPPTDDTHIYASMGGIVRNEVIRILAASSEPVETPSGSGIWKQQLQILSRFSTDAAPSNPYTGITTEGSTTISGIPDTTLLTINQYIDCPNVAVGTQIVSITPPAGTSLGSIVISGEALITSTVPITFHTRNGAFLTQDSHGLASGFSQCMLKLTGVFNEGGAGTNCLAFPILGALDSSTLAVATHLLGNAATNLNVGELQPVTRACTLTRDVDGYVNVVCPTLDITIYGGVTVAIVGSDVTFDYVGLGQFNQNDYLFSYSQATLGYPAGGTTGTLTLGTGRNTAYAYRGCEVIRTINPNPSFTSMVPYDTPGNYLGVEQNGIAWAGATIESPSHYAFHTAGYHLAVESNTPVKASIGFLLDFGGGATRSGDEFQGVVINNTNNSTDYLGSGGFYTPPPSCIQVNGPWQAGIDFTAVVQRQFTGLLLPAFWASAKTDAPQSTNVFAGPTRNSYVFGNLDQSNDNFNILLNSSSVPNTGISFSMQLQSTALPTIALTAANNNTGAGLIEQTAQYVHANGRLTCKGFRPAYSNITETYVMTNDDHTLFVNAEGGAVVVTLPGLWDNGYGRGAEIVIKKTDFSGSAVTFITADGTVIGDSPAPVLTAQNQYVRFNNDGLSTWWVVGGNY